jgi:hypothetical protein
MTHVRRRGPPSDRGLVRMRRLRERPGAPVALSALAERTDEPHAFLVPRGSLERLAGPGLLVAHDARVHRIRSVTGGSLWDPIVVGRDPGCDVWLDDRQISRHHATFERTTDRGDYLLLDAGSRNGVFVDGLRVPPWSVKRVHSHAVVELGRLGFLFLTQRDFFEMVARSIEPRGAAR